ncbi:MAG: DUF72 domain-containing protein, partial [Armatimonadetes bacterium]|nr:DUF72 domain-containing protein [Armatimonadota bacterium]
MIHLGTAGYHYDDWVGPVYPANLPRSQWLSHYAQRFNLVEINSSFYHPPSAAMVAGWSRRVPSDFRFVLKAWRGLTHGEPPPNEPFASFATALEPLREREQLLGVLVQYPTAIKLEKANVRRLRQLREQWPDLPLIVEFRHVSWADPR